MDLNRDPKERCVCAFSFDRSLQEVRKNRGAGSHNLLLFLAGGVRFRKSLISLLRNMHTRARPGRAFRHDQPVVPTRTRTGWWFYPPLDVGAVRAPRLLTYKQQQQQVVNYDPLRRRGDWGESCGRCHSWIHATTSRTTPLDLSSHPFDMTH